MSFRYKCLTALLVALVLSIVAKGCLHRDPTTITIPSDANAVVKVTPNGTTTATRDSTGKTLLHITADYGHGSTVVVKKDGTVDVKPKTFGIPNDLGLSTDFRAVGVANEFAYYKRCSVLGGSHFINLKTKELQFNLFIGIGYRLEWKKVNNVTLYTGVDTDKRIFAGLFLRVGND